MSSISSINPPNPQSPLFDGGEKSLGHRLLRLVRLAEKSTTTQELETLLSTLSQTFLRRGLLEGDVEKAEKILSSTTKSSSSGGASHRREKKSKKNDENEKAEFDFGASDDVNLLLSALVRLSGGNQELSSSRQCSNLSYHSIIGGFNVCIAVLQYLQSRPRHDPCAHAEYELMGGVARNLLTGVSRTVQGLDASGMAESIVVVSGFRVATLLVSLYGQRLSRNHTILSTLRSVAWDAICTPNENVRRQATSFLAALPLTGLEKKTPSVLWSVCIVDGCSALYLLIETVFPRKSKTSKTLDAEKAREYLSDSMKMAVSRWIDTLQKTESGEQRLLLFKFLISALSMYFVSLLEAQFLVTQDPTIISSAQFSLHEVIELLESMLSFPSFAESVYYGTKKRLRFEIVEGGLLNPHLVVNEVANYIKQHGLDIFDAVLQSLGRPILMPFGKRVVKAAHSALLSSCSMALRHALDPTTSIRTDGKRKKWLHTSIAMRTRAVMSFSHAMCTIGSNALVSSSVSISATRKGKANPANKGVALVVGCLLEQLVSNDAVEETWGSTREAAALVASAMDALAAILTQCGGFMSSSTRSLIDSVMKSCLEMVVKRTRHSVVMSISAVKVSCLRLSSACLVTPWPDGANTSLLEDIRACASLMSSDADIDVALQAQSCLQLINSMNTPRSPPLLMVTRSVTQKPVDDDASTIADRLKVVQQTIKVNNEEDGKEAAQNLKRKIEKREEEREATNDTKRAKVVLPPSPVNPLPSAAVEENVIMVEEEQGSKEKDTPHLTDDVPVENEKAAPESDDVLSKRDAAVAPAVGMKEIDADDDEMDFIPGIIDDGPDDED